MSLWQGGLAGKMSHRVLPAFLDRESSGRPGRKGIRQPTPFMGQSQGLGTCPTSLGRAGHEGSGPSPTAQGLARFGNFTDSP